MAQGVMKFLRKAQPQPAKPNEKQPASELGRATKQFLEKLPRGSKLTRVTLGGKTYSNPEK